MEELYQILDYILNKATDKEMEVIVEAIKKRATDRRSSPMAGMNLGQMSRETAGKIQSQLSMPMDGMRKMVREMVVKLIKQNVPDIPDEHLDALLKEWVPEEQPRPAPGETEKSALPPEVLLTMVRHFTKYSRGEMSPGEQAILREADPDWFESYWDHFPREIKILLNEHLKSRMSAEEFWQKIKASLK